MRTRPGCSSARRISANVLTRRKGRLHWRLEARRLCAWTSSTLPPGMDGLSYRCWKPYTVVFMNRRVRSALPLGLYATLQSPLIETRGWRTNTCTRGLSSTIIVREMRSSKVSRICIAGWDRVVGPTAWPPRYRCWRRLGGWGTMLCVVTPSTASSISSNIASTRRTDCPTRRWNMSGGATAVGGSTDCPIPDTAGTLSGRRCTRRCGRGRSNGGSAESITRTG